VGLAGADGLVRRRPKHLTAISGRRRAQSIGPKPVSGQRAGGRVALQLHRNAGGGAQRRAGGRWPR